MALYEEEFIEIRRENNRMRIVGTIHCSADEEDVQKYIKWRIAKEKRRVFGYAVLASIVWLLAAFIAWMELTQFNGVGSGGWVLILAFVAMAILCTVCFWKINLRSKAELAELALVSPEQCFKYAPAAIMWKQNKVWEQCYNHDLVPLQSVLMNRIIYGATPKVNPLDDAEQARRKLEEQLLSDYALMLIKSRAEQEKKLSNTLLVYLDIDRLAGGVYGFAAGQAIGKALPAKDLEGCSVSSGDSAATLSGSANEYVVGLSGSAEALDRMEERLRNDTAIKNLLSGSGIRRAPAFDEPLVADGTFRNGEPVPPAGRSIGFCAAGIRDAWKKAI